MDGIIEKLRQMWYNEGGNNALQKIMFLARLSCLLVADGTAFFIFNEILNISKNVEIVGNVGKWHSR